MKYTTLLMDADDTIFDFPKCEKEALRKSLEYYGLEFSDEINRNFSSINSALWKQFEKNRITRSELRVRRFRELIEKCFEGFSDCTDNMSTWVWRKLAPDAETYVRESISFARKMLDKYQL